MKVKPYPSYRPSGVEWLGLVPEAWSVEKVRRRVRLRTEKAENAGRKVALENIESWTGRFHEVEDADYSGEGIAFSEGDILFGKLRPYLAKVWRADSAGAAVGDFHVYSLAQNVESRFFQYMVLSRDFISKVDGSTYGAKMPRASWDFIANLAEAFPSPEEQRQIADYLDAQTAKIDALIGKQERLIETLAERRQAVISHAVTKGLDPNAPMKDSEVSWLGVVQASWTVVPIKRMATRITDGAHISPETDDGVFDFVSTKDIRSEGIDFEGALKTSPASFELLVRNGCQPVAGDVLFSKDGTVGRTVLIATTRPFVVASSLIIVRPDRSAAEPAFLNYLFQSIQVQEQVRSFVKGAGLPRLSIANLLRIVGVFPGLREQIEIAQHLDRETSQIDALAAKAREMIDVLKERRQALISAAVTGKIDVRTAKESA